MFSEENKRSLKEGAANRKQEVKIPEFHFKFDKFKFKFVREMAKAGENIDDVAKDTAFLSWREMCMAGECTLAGGLLYNKRPA